MKPVEHRVWYRRLLVRIRKFGWRLRTTPEGKWVLSRSGGLIIRRHPPRSRKACYDLAREMRRQERAAKKKEKHGPTPRPPRTTGPVWLFRDVITAEYNAQPASPRPDRSEHDNSVVSAANN